MGRAETPRAERAGASRAVPANPVCAAHQLANLFFGAAQSLRSLFRGDGDGRCATSQPVAPALPGPGVLLRATPSGTPACSPSSPPKTPAGPRPPLSRARRLRKTGSS